MPPARSSEQRKQDVLDRLANDVDAWVASAGDGAPWLVPLSFLWTGEELVFSTTASSPTGRNLRPGAPVRVGLGPTRDVILIDGTVRVTPLAEVSPKLAGDFAAAAGFDPREDKDSLYLHVRPQRLQAWREVNELKGRTLIRDGRWLV